MSIEETDKCRAVANAALELIVEQGFHGTPISQIAKHAGVGVGSIFRYFADKDELIHAIHARLEEKLHLALTVEIGGDLANRELFIQLVQALVRHLVGNPPVFKFLEQHFNSTYGIEKMREKFLEDADACLCSDREKPFFNLLSAGRGKTIKDLPVAMIHSLAFGPVIFLVRDILAGFVELNDDLLLQFGESGWDSIKI